MARRLRTRVKKNLTAAIAVAVYFVLVSYFGLPGFRGDQELTVSVTLIGAAIVYGLAYLVTGLMLKVLDRAAGSIR